LHHRLSIFLIALMSSAAAMAKGPALPPEIFEMGESVTVARIEDGRTLELADGRMVRLVGIDAPPFNGRHGAIYLRQTLEGQTVRLYYGKTRSDRWQRVVAHAVRDDGTWVQGDLLARGLARVMTTGDNQDGADAMLALESEARKDSFGLWAEDRFAILTPETVNGARGGFQIVEGRVFDAAPVRARVYLNFTADWKTDFTVLISAKVRKQFERAGIDLETLTNKTVRVRGWVRDWNGPLVELTHAAQLEVVDDEEMGAGLR
jgi:micrococcal nuclease